MSIQPVFARRVKIESASAIAERVSLARRLDADCIDREHTHPCTTFELVLALVSSYLVNTNPIHAMSHVGRRGQHNEANQMSPEIAPLIMTVAKHLRFPVIPRGAQVQLRRWLVRLMRAIREIYGAAPSKSPCGVIAPRFLSWVLDSPSDRPLLSPSASSRASRAPPLSEMP